MSKTTVAVSFTKIVSEMNKGASLVDLSQGLEQLTAAVRATGKGGSLTYKLTVKPASENNAETVILVDDISTKMPRAPRQSAIFFTTEENGLQRSDPRQVELPLRVVETAEQPVRQVPEAKQAS